MQLGIQGYFNLLAGIGTLPGLPMSGGVAVGTGILAVSAANGEDRPGRKIEKKVLLCIEFEALSLCLVQGLQKHFKIFLLYP